VDDTLINGAGGQRKNNQKYEYRNSKWFDRLTILSKSRDKLEWPKYEIRNSKAATDCTDLPSEMTAADSQMTTSFFMLQSWMRKCVDE